MFVKCKCFSHHFDLKEGLTVMKRESASYSMSVRQTELIETAMSLDMAAASRPQQPSCHHCTHTSITFQTRFATLLAASLSKANCNSELPASVSYQIFSTQLKPLLMPWNSELLRSTRLVTHTAANPMSGNVDRRHWTRSHRIPEEAQSCFCPL